MTGAARLGGLISNNSHTKSTLVFLDRGQGDVVVDEDASDRPKGFDNLCTWCRKANRAKTRTKVGRKPVRTVPRVVEKGDTVGLAISVALSLSNALLLSGKGVHVGDRRQRWERERVVELRKCRMGGVVRGLEGARHEIEGCACISKEIETCRSQEMN